MTRTILITGASSAIGCELIQKLDVEGTTIVAHYHSRPLTTDEQRPAKALVIPVQADLSVEKDIDHLISRVRDIGGGQLNAFVHLPAAKLNYTRLKSIDWSTVEHDFRIQVQSAAQICAAFLPEVVKRQLSCRVLFMLSSVVCGMPPKNLIPYTTVKYALLGFLRSLAAEYAGTGVSVNGLSPSFVESEFLSQVPSKLLEIAAEQHPLKRLAKPCDLSGLMAHLISDQCSYMTGVHIPITGGTVV